ncbi:hypothetical protein QBC34DRAFT_416699, partial [Podospora aff. communis PSN243]
MTHGRYRHVHLDLLFFFVAKARQAQLVPVDASDEVGTSQCTGRPAADLPVHYRSLRPTSEILARKYLWRLEQLTRRGRS